MFLAALPHSPMSGSQFVTAACLVVFATLAQYFPASLET